MGQRPKHVAVNSRIPHVKIGMSPDSSPSTQRRRSRKLSTLLSTGEYGAKLFSSRNHQRDISCLKGFSFKIAEEHLARLGRRLDRVFAPAPTGGGGTRAPPHAAPSADHPPSSAEGKPVGAAPTRPSRPVRGTSGATRTPIPWPTPGHHVPRDRGPRRNSSALISAKSKICVLFMNTRKMVIFGTVCGLFFCAAL